MISDETFRTELDKILKRQGHKKSERNYLISEAMILPYNLRDAYLDNQERKIEIKQETPLESTEQKQFVSWWRKNNPEHIIMMVRNDGYRTPREKVEQMAMGLHPGVADLYIPSLRCWVEMKRVKGSKWGEEQQAFKDYVESIGDTYLLCYGCQEAIDKIKSIMVTI